MEARKNQSNEMPSQVIHSICVLQIVLRFLCCNSIHWCLSYCCCYCCCYYCRRTYTPITHTVHVVFLSPGRQFAFDFQSSHLIECWFFSACSIHVVRTINCTLSVVVSLHHLHIHCSCVYTSKWIVNTLSVLWILTCNNNNQ